jgi:hypothetical protein
VSESRAHFKASLTSLSCEVSSHIAVPEISAKNPKATFTKSLSGVPRLKSGLASSVAQLMMLTSGDNSIFCPSGAAVSLINAACTNSPRAAHDPVVANYPFESSRGFPGSEPNWRVEVEADNLGGLGDKVRIVALTPPLARRKISCARARSARCTDPTHRPVRATAAVPRRGLANVGLGSWTAPACLAFKCASSASS